MSNPPLKLGDIVVFPPYHDASTPAYWLYVGSIDDDKRAPPMAQFYVLHTGLMPTMAFHVVEIWERL